MKKYLVKAKVNEEMEIEAENEEEAKEKMIEYIISWVNDIDIEAEEIK